MDLKRTNNEEEVTFNKPLGGMGAIRNQLKEIGRYNELPIFIALLVLCVAISFLSPFFLTWQNIFNVLRQFSVIAILAVGQGLIIITGGIDLSVGAILGLMKRPLN